MKQKFILFLFLILASCESGKVKVVNHADEKIIENRLYIIYDETYGLTINAKVEALGIKIGNVVETSIIKRDSVYKILVEIRLDSNTRIPKNSVFQLGSSDLLGNKSIRIIYSNNNEFISWNDTIIGTAQPTLQEKIDAQIDNISLDSSLKPIVLKLEELNKFFDTLETMIKR